jgi:hypothetical protein
MIQMFEFSSNVCLIQRMALCAGRFHQEVLYCTFGQNGQAFLDLWRKLEGMPLSGIMAILHCYYLDVCLENKDIVLFDYINTHLNASINQ